VGYGHSTHHFKARQAYPMLRKTISSIDREAKVDHLSAELNLVFQFKRKFRKEHNDCLKLIQSYHDFKGAGLPFSNDGGICGSKQYFFSNANVLSSRDIFSGEIKLVLNVSDFAKVVPNYVSILKMKASIDHRFVAFLVELSGESTPGLFVKDVGNNVISRLNISCGRDFEVGDFEWTESSFLIVLADSLHRPYRLVKLKNRPYDRNDCLDKKGSSIRGIISDASQILTSYLVREEDVHELMAEPDQQYFVDIGRSKDDTFVFVTAQSKLSSEVRYMIAKDTAASSVVPEVVTMFNRQLNAKYFVDHDNDYFYVASNVDISKEADALSSNHVGNSNRSVSRGEMAIYRLRSLELTRAMRETEPPSQARWRRLWPSDDFLNKVAFVEDFDVVGDKVIVYGRRDGIPVVEFVETSDDDSHLREGVSSYTPSPCIITELTAGIREAMGSECYEVAAAVNKSSRLRVANFTVSNICHPGLKN
jgi:protease II